MFNKKYLLVPKSGKAKRKSLKISSPFLFFFFGCCSYWMNLHFSFKSWLLFNSNHQWFFLNWKNLIILNKYNLMASNWSNLTQWGTQCLIISCTCNSLPSRFTIQFADTLLRRSVPLILVSKTETLRSSSKDRWSTSKLATLWNSVWFPMMASVSKVSTRVKE